MDSDPSPNSETDIGPPAMRTEEILPLVDDELRRLAAGRLMQGAAGAALQPTALVHEAWIRLGGKTWSTARGRRPP